MLWRAGAIVSKTYSSFEGPKDTCVVVRAGVVSVRSGLCGTMLFHLISAAMAAMASSQDGSNPCIAGVGFL